MAEVVVGNTSVKVKTGDITKECTDALVNLNNNTLDQNFGVSKEILAAAGDAVRKECASLGTIHNDAYAVTKAGNLKVKNILHLVAVTSPRIVESVKRALKACDEHKFTTVSLPAFGTGAAGLDPQSSIKFIFEGLEVYLIEVGASTIISEITIVVNKQDVYKEYMTFFQNYQTNYSYFKTCGKAIVLKKGDITDQSGECILNLTNSTLNQSMGVSKAILDAAGDAVKEECKLIGSLKANGIELTSGGKLKSKKIMHAVGPTKVKHFEEFMEKILLECCKNSIKSLVIPAIGTGMAGVPPEDSIKAILDGILKHLENSSTTTLETIIVVVLQENIYKAYLKVFLEKKTELQKKMGRMQVNIDFPKSWTNMNEKKSTVVTLDENSEEYKKVTENFLSTAGSESYTLLNVERIQNTSLFLKFCLNKQEVERKYPNQQNVRLLYHGTSVNAIKNINEGGFNRTYGSVMAYGKGSYFAVNAEYSCSKTYSKPDGDGKKYIYQTTVVTGKYCKGTRDMMEPSYIGNDPDAGRYDCATDNVNKPSMFVVFYDNYAYPEYLITFK